MRNIEKNATMQTMKQEKKNGKEMPLGRVMNLIKNMDDGKVSEGTGIYIGKGKYVISNTSYGYHEGIYDATSGMTVAQHAVVAFEEMTAITGNPVIVNEIDFDSICPTHAEKQGKCEDEYTVKGKEIEKILKKCIA